MTLASNIVNRILETSADNYGLLHRCSLVNWEFNHAASRLLYFRVVLSPPFQPVLNLRVTRLIPETSNFLSALIQRNAVHVCILEVSGFVFPRPPPRNTISEKITSGIKQFINLRSVQFVPMTYHEELFVPSLPVLLETNTLNEVEVNASCSDEHRAPNLVKLGNLRKLSLIGPGRAILQLLPDWLSRLSETLAELHLKSNCGSVTPGVLRSLLPHLKHNIRALTLGLSYSLTNEDVFSFLGELPNLERLQLRYYWQIKQPRNQPKLLALRSFTATYDQVLSKKDANELDKWIRRAIAGSSKLEEVRMVPDRQESDDSDSGPAVAHDAIVDHIVRKHADTIRVLRFCSAFVSVKGLKALFGTCKKLEECQFRVRKEALSILASSQEKLPVLHTVSFQICNVKRTYQVAESVVSELMLRSLALRQLSVNGSAWKVEWKTKFDQGVEAIIESDVKSIPPWSRNIPAQGTLVPGHWRPTKRRGRRTRLDDSILIREA